MVAFLKQLWRNHSLSIVLTALGSGLTAVALLLPPGKLFDLTLGMGIGFLTVALFYVFSGKLREVNKPEDS